MEKRNQEKRRLVDLHTLLLIIINTVILILLTQLLLFFQAEVKRKNQLEVQQVLSKNLTLEAIDKVQLRIQIR